MGARLGAGLSLAGLTLQVLLAALAVSVLSSPQSGPGLGAIIGLIILIGFGVLFLYIPSMILFLAAAISARGVYSPVTGAVFTASGILHLITSILVLSTASLQNIPSLTTAAVAAIAGVALLVYGLRRLRHPQRT